MQSQVTAQTPNDPVSGQGVRESTSSRRVPGAAVIRMGGAEAYYINDTRSMNEEEAEFYARDREERDKVYMEQMQAVEHEAAARLSRNIATLPGPPRPLITRNITTTSTNDVSMDEEDVQQRASSAVSTSTHERLQATDRLIQLHKQRFGNGEQIIDDELKGSSNNEMDIEEARSRGRQRAPRNQQQQPRAASRSSSRIQALKQQSTRTDSNGNHQHSVPVSQAIQRQNKRRSQSRSTSRSPIVTNTMQHHRQQQFPPRQPLRVAPVPGEDEHDNDERQQPQDDDDDQDASPLQPQECFMCNTEYYTMGNQSIYEYYTEFFAGFNVRLTYEFDGAIMSFVRFHKTFRSVASTLGIHLPYMDHKMVIDHLVMHVESPAAQKHMALQFLFPLAKSLAGGVLLSSWQNGQLKQTLDPARLKFLGFVMDKWHRWYSTDALRNDIRARKWLEDDAKSEDGSALTRSVGHQLYRTISSRRNRQIKQITDHFSQL